MTNPSDSQRKPARATRLDKAPVARAPEIPAGEALAAAVDDDDSLSSDDPLGDETVERPRPTPRAQAEGVPLPVVGQGAAQAVHDGDGFDAETTEVKSPFARPLSRPRANPLLDAVAEAAAQINVPSDMPPPGGFIDEHTVSARLPAYSDEAEALPFETSAALDEKTGDARRAHKTPTTSDGGEDSESAEENSATVEGAPIDDGGTDLSALAPGPGQFFTADDGTTIRLEDALGEQGGSVFFRARLANEEQAFTAVWTPLALPEPPWSHLPDPRVVRPRCRATLDKAAVRVFERPKGNTVVDYLNDDERVLPAMATLELGIELAELLESLHGAGQAIYDLDPSQIVIERGGRVRLYAVSGLIPFGAAPTQAPGLFCAPEVRRRLKYRMGAHSDVYAVALLVYALLAKRAPLEVELDPSHLVSPRVFRPECPLGIWPQLRACLEPNPARRVGFAGALRQRLEKARDRLIEEAQAADDATEVMLDAWTEQHVGITKSRRGSGQQDRAICVTDASARVGLYLVADGVSRSKYGDGAFAAEQVEIAGMQRWSGLERGGPAALDLNHTQRSDVMKQISRSAGKRISNEVNAKYAPLANEPNQVMSATLVAMFAVHGEATFGNLGDSRAYLIRRSTIEQITIDHDRVTDALRMGLSFKDSANVSMGAALTRVVGRVIIDDNGGTRADPFEPEVFRVRLLPGDKIVLCSDGVADFAAGAGAPPAEADAKILETALTYDDPARTAFELVVLANRAGGYDNISCVVIHVHAV